MSASETLSAVAIGISVISFIGSSLLSYYLAKRYGDRAGAQAAIDHAEKKESEARIIGLQALLNEARRIRKLAEYNSTLKYDHKWPKENVANVLKMPVSAFETALLSRESSLFTAGEHDPDSEPFSSIAAYLTEAQAINQHVDTYYSLLRGLSAIDGSGGYGAGGRANALKQIKERSQVLPETLDRLEKHLKGELKTKT